MENAFMILAMWQKQAKESGMAQEWIDKVLLDAESSDYDHLVQVLEENEI